ncbi:MAG: hypothetical protein OWT28_00170 [Firmicutes bacterium]|nr:hypothetical protein [Bacillota bacterium]
MHPLYHHARSLVGQPVYVQAGGRTHYGILHHVTSDGIYLRKGNANGMASGVSEHSLETLPFSTADNTDTEPAFWPFFFLPWLAIGALGAWWW